MENEISTNKNSKLIKEIKSWAIIILIALGLKSTIIASYMVPTGSMENTIMTGDFLIGNKFVFGTTTPDWIGIPYTRVGFNIPSFRLPDFTKPEQGDILIFKFPNNTRVRYVKRCVAGPGQTMEIKQKKLFINGQRYKLPATGKFVESRVLDPDFKQRRIFTNDAANKDNFGPLYIPEKGDTLTVDNTPEHLLKNVLDLSGKKYNLNSDGLTINGENRDYYVTKQDYYFMMGDNRDKSYDSRYWGLVSHELVIGKPLFVFLSWNNDVPFYRISELIRWNRIGKFIKG